MRLICAWCQDCMDEHGKTEDDPCPFHHPSQVTPENAAVGYLCEHHHIRLVRPAKKKPKRKKK